jgi:hypothetical protein
MLNIKELQKLNKKREELKLEPYKKIFTVICSKIDESAKILARNYCIYQVPELVFGYSSYNINDCCIWLKNELLNQGVVSVDIMEHNILVIKW